MTQVEIQLYDAFSTQLFGGNVAGVVHADKTLDDDTMQRVAAEVPVATTGFVSKLSDKAWQVRFFTPTQEIDMCGHVVVGVFTALAERGALRLDGHAIARTRAGDIGVKVVSGTDGPLVEMVQRRPVFRAIHLDRAELAKLLGIASEDEHPALPVEIASTALSHLVVSTRGVPVLAALKPDYGGLANLSRQIGVDTIAVIAIDGLAPRVDVRVRDLCPGIGNAEESASGTTNGAVACYLVRHSDAASQKPTMTFRAEQGVEMGRPSLIETSIDVQPDGEIVAVRVRGRAVQSLRGFISLP
jgi:trans-2,3-dihydro-3-hydroxyanthranilate isomerase